MTNNTHSNDSDPKSPGFYTPMDIAPGEHDPTPHSSELANDFIRSFGMELLSSTRKEKVIDHYETQFDKIIASERQKAVDELENGVKYYFISYAHPKGFGSIYFYAEHFLDIDAASDEIKAMDNFSSIVIIAINPISKRQYDAATNSNKGETE